MQEAISGITSMLFIYIIISAISYQKCWKLVPIISRFLSESSNPHLLVIRGWGGSMWGDRLTNSCQHPCNLCPPDGGQRWKVPPISNSNMRLNPFPVMAEQLPRLRNQLCASWWRSTDTERMFINPRWNCINSPQKIFFFFYISRFAVLFSAI